MTFSRRVLIAFCALAVILTTAICTDIAITQKKGILNGIEFSAAFSDRNSELLHVYLTSTDKYRVYKSVTEFPPDFIEALLLQEDRKFYAHHGINPVSVIRAGFETYIRRSRKIGASTVTMQTAKLKYNIYTRNIGGKLKQIFLALRLESLFSKQDILDAYVNLAPCGKNLEGFESAAVYFFGRSISDLDLSQKLILCVLPQNPVKRCPSIDHIPQDLLDARLRLFSEWIKLHPEDSSLLPLMNSPIQLVCAFPDKAPHFTRLVNQTEKAQLGITRTTLDLRLQNLVQEHISNYILQNRRIGINNAAVLLADSETMEVRAEIGSASFYDEKISGQVDVNTAKRSPGSALKPFIYALSLEQGKIHYSTMLKDVPSAFSEYTPDNYGKTFKGPLAAWQALTESRNIPAVQLARELNNPDFYDFLYDAQISDLKKKDEYGLSLVLGSAEVTPFELTTLYCMLKNDGVLKNLSLLKKSDGRAKKADSKRQKKMLKTESCFITRKMLEQNPPVTEHRPAAAKLIPIGFKTGTSIGFRDSWTVGFFGKYVLCVWIGNCDGSGNNAFLGRTAAAPLFFSIADSMIERGYVSAKKEEIPTGVAYIDVCSVSGALPNDDCPHKEKAWFIPGVSPITKCRIHRKILVDKRTGFRTDEYDARYTEYTVREFWPSDIMELFKLAGLPRLLPPGYPPEEKQASSVYGFPPQILSPLAYTEYVFREQTPERNNIVLNASADADSTELFWFKDSLFIAKTKPGEQYIWTPTPGTYTLTVTDSKGRSSSRTVKIR